MAQALYRRWRPQTWGAVVGQDHVIQTLRNAVKADRVAHAYLFAGPRGTGKTTTARLLAKAVNCQDPDLANRPCNQCEPCRAVAEGRFMDLIEIDAASNTSVEDVRDLRDKINFSPNEGRYKVYIVDEVHMLSTAAFNALLKTLEEPPDHAIFVLATTEVHKIPATVLSRCQRHEFRRLPVAVILDFLKERVEQEGFNVEPEALELIARQATGSLRDAISLLDQLTSTGDKVDLARAQSVLGTATEQAVIGVVQALVEEEAANGLTLLNRAVDSGADPRQLARQIVAYLRSVLLVRMGNPDLVEALESVRQQMKAQAESMSLEKLMVAIDSFNVAALESRASWQPKLPLELAFVAALNPSQSETSGEAASSVPKPAGSHNPPKQSAAGASVAESKSGGPAMKEKQTPEDAGEKAVESKVEQEEAVSPPPPAGPVPEGELTYQTVLDRWEQILAACFERDPRCQALLNSGRPLGLRKGKLVVGFASDILRDKMQKDDNMAMVAAALEDVLGQKVGLRCVLTSQWDQDAPPRQTPPVEDGGMVATAVRDLGAEVTEIEPVDEEEKS
ncbi:MAG: DNA polymerase III subunit gamma/tau [Anaerolineales bacterium]